MDRKPRKRIVEGKVFIRNPRRKWKEISRRIKRKELSNKRLRLSIITIIIKFR